MCQTIVICFFIFLNFLTCTGRTSDSTKLISRLGEIVKGDCSTCYIKYDDGFFKRLRKSKELGISRVVGSVGLSGKETDGPPPYQKKDHGLMKSSGNLYFKFYDTQGVFLGEFHCSKLGVTSQLIASYKAQVDKLLYKDVIISVSGGSLLIKVWGKTYEVEDFEEILTGMVRNTGDFEEAKWRPLLSNVKNSHQNTLAFHELQKRMFFFRRKEKWILHYRANPSSDVKYGALVNFLRSFPGQITLSVRPKKQELPKQELPKSWFQKLRGIFSCCA